MPTIAVTGATGAVGGMVAARLAARGVSSRLVVRDASRAPMLPGAQVTTIPGYHDGEAVRRALVGADALFLVSGEEAHDRLTQHVTAVQAAADAGVTRIVYTSFLGAAPDATFTLARDHFHTEEAIAASGLAFSALRTNLYQDVLPAFVNDGVIRGPAGDGRFSPVARTDVADVAVACLLLDHDLGAIDVTGPQLLTMHEVAQTLSRIRDEPIRYEPETMDEAIASRAHLGAEPWQVAAWVSSYAAIAAGDLDAQSDAVERLAGHPPLRLETLLRAG